MSLFDAADRRVEGAQGGQCKRLRAAPCLAAAPGALAPGEEGAATGGQRAEVALAWALAHVI